MIGAVFVFPSAEDEEKALEISPTAGMLSSFDQVYGAFELVSKLDIGAKGGVVQKVLGVVRGCFYLIAFLLRAVGATKSSEEGGGFFSIEIGLGSVVVICCVFLFLFFPKEGKEADRKVGFEGLSFYERG